VLEDGSVCGVVLMGQVVISFHLEIFFGEVLPFSSIYHFRDEDAARVEWAR
jgi:hypothetical protein